MKLQAEKKANKKEKKNRNQKKTEKKVNIEDKSSSMTGGESAREIEEEVKKTEEEKKNNSGKSPKSTTLELPEETETSPSSNSTISENGNSNQISNPSYNNKTSILEESNKVIEVKDLPPEQYYGNLEYKLKLVHTNKDRIEGLTTQMKFRLQEGQGECFYMIGVEDNGNPLGLNDEELKQSLDTLKTISEKLGAKFCILKEHQGKVGKFAEIMITVENFIHNKMEIKIGLIGEESSGKSSIV